MNCRNCGKKVADQAVVCPSCGLAPTVGKQYCQNCGAQTNPLAEVCIKCGVRLATAVPAGQGQKSKLAAGLLGIFLGCFGVHRFYLGYTNIAIAQLILGLLGIVTCGITTVAAGIWGLIDGIMILAGSIDKDAAGQPLKD
jgi:TM2 domain-containing membrane protein YozV